MKKYWAFCLMLTCLVRWCPAPIRDDDPSVGYQPELSQEEVAQQQALQRQIGVVGEVPTIKRDVPYQREEVKGESSGALQAAAAQLNNPVAAENIVNAPKQQSGSSLWKYFLWGFAALCLGIGAMKGARYWMDRTIPVPAPTKKPNWK